MTTSPDLRARQAPLKDRYRADPAAALTPVHARAEIDQARVACRLVGSSPADPGLHAATGGDGSFRCSGDMLLEALVACAGVTCAAVATAMGITLRAAGVTADAVFDARGTLGVSRDAPVGLTGLRLAFTVDTDATDEQLATLLGLTERYCVVLRTLAAGAPAATTIGRG